MNPSELAEHSFHLRSKGQDYLIQITGGQHSIKLWKQVYL